MRESSDRSKWWSDFLAPVIVATIVAAVGGLLNNNVTQAAITERMASANARIDSLETLVTEQGKLLREIREDVAFVRGRIERNK